MQGTARGAVSSRNKPKPSEIDGAREIGAEYGEEKQDTPVRCLLDVVGGQRNGQVLVNKISPRRFGGRGRFLRKLVLIAIAASANADGMGAYPSMGTIAERSLLGDTKDGRRAARRAVEWLKKHNIIKVKENAHEVRPGVFTNEYVILLDEANRSKNTRGASKKRTSAPANLVKCPPSREKKPPANSRPERLSENPGLCRPPLGDVREDNYSEEGGQLNERGRTVQSSNRPFDRPIGPDNRLTTSIPPAAVVAERTAPPTEARSTPPRKEEIRKARAALNATLGLRLAGRGITDAQICDFIELAKRRGERVTLAAWEYWQDAYGDYAMNGAESRSWPLREFLNSPELEDCIQDVSPYAENFSGDVLLFLVKATSWGPEGQVAAFHVNQQQGEALTVWCEARDHTHLVDAFERMCQSEFGETADCLDAGDRQRAFNKFVNERGIWE